jgi:hypothetical protein
MNVKSNKIWILFVVVFFILFSNIIFSNPSLFTDPRKCSDVFINCTNATIDDVIITSNRTICNGIEYNGPSGGIEEVYINATNFFPNSGINVTCKYEELESYVNYIYIWYYNGSDWFNIQNFTNISTAVHESFNVSAVFNVNSTAGQNAVRCIYSLNFSGKGQIPTECANTTYSFLYDNDDVNFTVTSHLAYDFWNLTNYTNGSEIASGQTFNRNTLINVSAHWNKTIYNAWVKHNGTGTWVNYTICSFPKCIGNWTNYTLNLSNASEFNRKNITIRAIYATDIYEDNNYTSPNLNFNMEPGLEPNISSYWLYPSTNRTNLHTNLTVYANVSDDVGIFAVSANITYPNNESLILNLTGNPSNGNQTWSFTFDTENVTLNETGNYTVWWVRINDTGDQITNITQNLTFYVMNNLTVTVSVPSSTPSKGTPINPVSISIHDINNNYHQFPVNLTIRCLNISYSDTSFSVFNVSGQTTFTHCYAPDSYSTAFNITVNVSDHYNNTGENYTPLITAAQEIAYVPSGGGGGGGFTTTPTKKCSDNTSYDQCSSKLPYFCSNGTLIRKCSRCGCYNSSYSCQPDGSCALIKEEDFNFNLSAARLEIRQGGDKEIIGVLKNTGNTVLELMSFYNASEYCCNISMPPSFELKEKEEKAFTILIHAPLFAVIGEYPNTTISIGTNLFRKDKTIDITVGQSQHYNSLSELENELADIENKIQEVKKAGIDTSNLEAMVEKSKALLQNANSSIAGDQIDVLSASLANLTSNNQLVESRLGGLRNQAFLLQNAWLIGLFVVMSFTTMYMVPQVLLPLNKKEKELSELKEEEETLVLSRVETEKQYFMRKIDENTFSKIMIGKQDRILKLRVQIREKENERIQIIKSVSPLAMATWFANGIKGIPKKIKNSPKSILNRKNKNNIDNDGKTQ